jgi:hypothetical protein
MEPTTAPALVMRTGAISFAARIRKTAVDAYLQRMFKAFEFCLPTNATKVWREAR